MVFHANAPKMIRKLCSPYRFLNNCKTAGKMATQILSLSYLCITDIACLVQRSFVITHGTAKRPKANTGKKQEKIKMSKTLFLLHMIDLMAVFGDIFCAFYHVTEVQLS